MSMNEFLAQYYGNTAPEAEYEKTASEEEQEAQIELFAKLAHDNGIDLEKLSEEQVQELFEATFKEASETEEPVETNPLEDTVKAAEEEFAVKKASQEKIAEADFLGRVMAHSYVNEMRKIAESKVANDDKDADDKPGKKEKDDGDDKDDKKAPPFMKKEEKTGSAIDELAVARACGMIDEYNKTAAANGQGQFDEKVAEARIYAIATLGLGESVKVASASNTAQAVDIRALEYLQAAGYPVTWAE